MITSRLISNISYNTDSFFKNVVEDLVNEHIIEFCYWIRHEADEDDKKSHIHLVLRPSKRLDTAILKTRFDEYVPCEKKPLSVTNVWRFTSNMDDWLLYCCHDTAYLNSKHLSRQIIYDWSDFHYTDESSFHFDVSMIDRVKFDRLSILDNAVKMGVPFFQLVQNGIVPISQRSQWEYQYKELYHYYFVSHDDDINNIMSKFTPIDDAVTTNNGKK